MLSEIRRHTVRDIRESLRLDRTAMHPGSAARAALVSAAMTVTGMAMGSPSAAISLTIGALFVYLTEGNAPLGRRARLMLWTGLWLSLATLIGGIVAPSILALLILTPLVAVTCGFIGAAGARAGLVGVMCLVLFTIAAGNPLAISDAIANAGFVLAGALVQTVISLLSALMRGQTWDVDTTVPIRHRLMEHGNAADDFVRHGLRLAVTVTIATAISISWDFDHSYWIPMTVAWMTRPDTDGTVTRVSGRILGTCAGLALIALTFQVTSTTDAVIVACVLISAFVAALFIFANYALAVTGITILVVTLFAIDGDPVQHTAPVRMLATIIAALIVLPVSLIGRTRT